MTCNRDVSQKFHDVLTWIEGEQREPRAVEDRTLQVALDMALRGEHSGALRCLTRLLGDDPPRRDNLIPEPRYGDMQTVAEWRTALRSHGW